MLAKSKKRSKKMEANPFIAKKVNALTTKNNLFGKLSVAATSNERENVNQFTRI